MKNNNMISGIGDNKQAGYVNILSAGVVISGLFLISLKDYLLFHSLIEIFSILIAFSIFLIAWNTKRFIENQYLTVIGIAYLFVGLLDLTHTLAYKGMGVFEGDDANPATQLWMAARYLESISLLIAPWFLTRKIRYSKLYIAYFAVFSIILSSIFYLKAFPACYVEGTGLTSFKKNSEYIICLILAASGFYLYKERNKFEKDVLRMLIIAIIMTIISELSFTLYVSVYGLSNLVGHYFKLFSFYFIYRAIIITGFVRPYDLIFRDLKKNEEALHSAKEGLEARVAELKRAEEKTDSLNTELGKTNKELHQVIYMVSHDLRSPLVNINGYQKEIVFSLNELKQIINAGEVPEVIKKKAVSIIDEDIPEDVEYVNASIGKMESLLNGLLQLSRTGTVELVIKELDMNSIISDISAVFDFQIKESGARLEVSELPPCAGDESKINQVFSNLIGNALKYLDPSRPGMIMVSGRREEGNSIYCVEDNGIGIAPEYLGNIFDIFYQANKRSGGEGLGLSIVKKIVERHSGKVWVESEVGRGSRFYVSLPV